MGSGRRSSVASREILATHGRNMLCSGAVRQQCSRRLRMPRQALRVFARRAGPPVSGRRQEVGSTAMPRAAMAVSLSIRRRTRPSTKATILHRFWQWQSPSSTCLVRHRAVRRLYAGALASCRGFDGAAPGGEAGCTPGHCVLKRRTCSPHACFATAARSRLERDCRLVVRSGTLRTRAIFRSRSTVRMPREARAITTLCALHDSRSGVPHPHVPCVSQVKHTVACGSAGRTTVHGRAACAAFTSPTEASSTEPAWTTARCLTVVEAVRPLLAGASSAPRRQARSHLPHRACPFWRCACSAGR